jgi:hypothetical protein
MPIEGDHPMTYRQEVRSRQEGPTVKEDRRAEGVKKTTIAGFPLPFAFVMTAILAAALMLIAKVLGLV